ncbi:MAG: NAD kinase [Bacteroidota bacterium]
MKHVLIFSRYVKASYMESFDLVKQMLTQWGCQIYASEELHDYLHQEGHSTDIVRIKNHQELTQSQVDTVITLGGDGTILGATALIGRLQIPIMGINLGRLGFLAGTEKAFIADGLTKLYNGHYRIEERAMIYLESHPGLFDGFSYGLNDFTVHKRDTSSMITIHTYINGDYQNSYWADGLIVATPTGSTGYSLSCGGPIIFPGAGTLVITPVAPHNLNIRPLVIPDTSVVSFSVEGRTKNFLCTLDSRYETITADHQLAVRRADFNTRLIILKGQSFLKTIHEKLSWGADQRN